MVESVASGTGTSLPARDRYETEMAALWAEVLQSDSFGLEDNFFDVGGASLDAVRLISGIERHFGVRLPLREMYDEASVATLAQRLRSRRARAGSGPLVAVRRQGSRPPLFVAPHIGGDVLPYIRTLRRLESSQPSYGLESPGLEPDEDPLDRVEDVASTFICAVRTLQPSGPYYLAGWSFGGLVAYEMACQLARNGQQVALLANFDTSPRHVRPAIPENDICAYLVWRFGWCLSLSESQLRELAPADRLRRIIEDVSARETNLQHLNWLDPDRARARIAVERANYEAVWRYRPGPYAGSMLLLRSAQNRRRARDLGWGKLAREVNVQIVPGEHRTMVEEPNAAVLARRLQDGLDRARM